MANQDHLGLLKQGVDEWNQWRRENPGLRPDLNGADLSRANLWGADFSDADLSRANLNGAELNGATLWDANLVQTDLTQADLTEAQIIGASLTQAILREAKFFKAVIAYTVFGDVDLSSVKGLDTVKHDGPSTIGIDTIVRSQGKVPEIFLRKAGVPDSIIEAIPALVGFLKPIDFYSCFISYSSKDQDFAECLYADLQSKGVRCWFAPEDMDIGDKIRPRIEESIRLYDKLLLVLSKSSVASGWVEREVKTALARERKEKRLVLFPVRIDGAVFESPLSWATEIRHERNIGDFTRWKDHDTYQKAFNRLLRALKAEAQKMRSRDGTANGG